MSNEASFLRIATDRSVMSRAARIALIVGVILIAINHGDRMMQGAMTATDWIKCALTFLVPYCVSTYSSVMAVRDQTQRIDDT